MEITLCADIEEMSESGVDYFHLTGEDDESKVEITFKMPSSGEFSNSYDIQCSNLTTVLKGNCDFTITSVEGEFVPN
ncbi:MAG: hypothetical protein LUD73_05905 [Lachnospiraceae bacterium]|nr:hypothetical protein [Lachnospiraceae bacterium]